MSFHRLLPSFSFLKSDRRISAGAPHPLGATWDGRGTNFALFSANAEKVELCLFDKTGRREIERIALPERTEDVWHGYLPDVAPGQLYGYRVHGPYEPERGHRFNPHKLLLDPYAKRLPAASCTGATRISAIAPATSARTCRSTAATTRAACRSRWWSTRPTPGATTGIRRCRGKTPSSTRRTSKA